MKPRFSRRDFLKFSLLSLGGAFLAACERALKPTPGLPTETSVALTDPSTPLPPTATGTSAPTPTEPQPATRTALACFILLAPPDGSKLKATGKATFAWEAMPGAVKYRLSVILPSGQEVIFETDQISRDQYLEALRTGGKYQWQVTALDANGTVICTAETFTFEKPEYTPPAPTKTKKSGGNDDDGEPGPSGTDGSGAGSTGSWSSGSDV